MSLNNHRSNSTELILLGTTSTIAIGFSLYLWRSLSRLEERLEVLEGRQEAEDSRRIHSHRTSPRRSSHHPQTLEREALAEGKDGARSLQLDFDGEYPPPEVVLTEDDDLPVRFERAGKGDEEEGRRRFKVTLEWRERHEMNTALYREWPNFELIKQHYPHYFHGMGLNGEPVFYEQPPKTDLKALRHGGVDLKGLLQHYAMICEFQWQYVTRDDMQKSIYIIDLDGMGMYDFVGECKDFVRQASEFAAAHYPERAGVVLVVNVPYWFKMVWNVVSKWVDEVTLQKIFILRGKDEIFNTLSEKIDVKNIPKTYGGESPYELGDSLEEQLLRNLMKHNNEMAEARSCPNSGFDEPCRFCNFRYARNY